MEIKSYDDLKRSAQLLKKLLKPYTETIKLAECQELVAKLGFYAHLHEAQQRLNTTTSEQPKANWTITTQPIALNKHHLLQQLQLSLFDQDHANIEYLHKYIDALRLFLHAYTRDVFQDVLFVEPEQWLRLTSFENIYKYKDFPAMQKYLNHLSSDNDEVMLRIKHNNIIGLLKEYMKPYYYGFEKDQFSNVPFNADCFVHTPIGSGSSIWRTHMLINWMIKNQGKKIVIISNQTTMWRPIITYIQEYSKNLNVYIPSSDLVQENMLSNENILIADLVYLPLSSSYGQPSLLQKNYQNVVTHIENLKFEKNTLLVLDSNHSQRETILRRPDTNKQYVLFSDYKSPAEEAMMRNQITTHFLPADKHIVFAISSTLEMIKLKNELVKRIGYKNMIETIPDRIDLEEIYRTLKLKDNDFDQLDEDIKLLVNKLVA